MSDLTRRLDEASDEHQRMARLLDEANGLISYQEHVLKHIGDHNVVFTMDAPLGSSIGMACAFTARLPWLRLVHNDRMVQDGEVGDFVYSASSSSASSPSS